MFSRFSMWKRLATMVLPAVPALGLISAQAQSGGRAAAGGGSAGATNFQIQITAGPEKPLPGEGRMDKIEDDLFGTHRRLDMPIPETETPTIPRRLLTTPQMDSNAKQKLDAEKNWAFSGMNELNSPTKLEDMLGMPELGPDGRPKPKISAMEQYYDNLGDNKLQAGSNSLTEVISMMWTVKQLGSTNSLNPIVYALSPGDQTLMKTMIMLPELSHGNAGPTGTEDSTSASDTIVAAQAAATANREEVRRRDTFRQLLGIDPSPPAGSTPLFGSGNNSPSSAPVAVPIYNSGNLAAPFTPSSLTPVAGGLTPPGGGGFHPYDGGFAASPAGPAGISGDNPRPALAQPASVLPPPVLDPFAQNFPKRKF